MNSHSYRARRTALKLALHHHRASTDESEGVLKTAEQFRKFLSAEHVATKPAHDFESLKAAHNCPRSQSVSPPANSDADKTSASKNLEATKGEMHHNDTAQAYYALMQLRRVLDGLDDTPRLGARKAMEAMRRALQALKVLVGENG
jgi:hypothetical protein